MKLIYAKTLPIELTNGNDGQGGRWFKSATVRKKLEVILRQLGCERVPFDFPVEVHVTRILGKGQRLWDSSSVLRGNYKQLEDALVVLGWFHDDSTKYITHTAGFQDGNQRGLGPAVKIEIFEL
jgi:hypothetical protein